MEFMAAFPMKDDVQLTVQTSGASGTHVLMKMTAENGKYLDYLVSLEDLRLALRKLAAK